MEKELQDKFEAILKDTALAVDPTGIIEPMILTATSASHKIALEAMFAAYNLGRESKWIKCSERLPEPEQFVLAVVNKGSIFMMYYGLAVVHDKQNNWFYNDEIIKPYMKPTHWQPLPEPPKN